MIKPSIAIRFVVFGILFNVSVCYAEADKVATEDWSASSLNTQPSKELKTLFLDHETRVMIDKQRAAYLNPPTAEPEKKSVEPKSTVSAVKKVYIPPKVAISAVIVKPDGSTIVRVNDKFNHSPSKLIQVDNRHSSIEGVPVIVQGKTQVVPVGNTLMTHSNKLVPTYKLEEQKRAKALPKTEETSVDATLKDVKLINADKNE